MGEAAPPRGCGGRHAGGAEPRSAPVARRARGARLRRVGGAEHRDQAVEREREHRGGERERGKPADPRAASRGEPREPRRQRARERGRCGEEMASLRGHHLDVDPQVRCEGREQHRDDVAAQRAGGDGRAAVL